MPFRVFHCTYIYVIFYSNKLTAEDGAWNFTTANDYERKAKAEPKKNSDQTRIQLRQNCFFYEVGNCFKPAVSSGNHTPIN